jgi:hypothetical protein
MDHQIEYRQFEVRQLLDRGMTLRAAQAAAQRSETELRSRMGLRPDQAILLGPNKSLLVAERGEG